MLKFIPPILVAICLHGSIIIQFRLKYVQIVESQSSETLFRTLLAFCTTSNKNKSEITSIIILVQRNKVNFQFPYCLY